MIERNINFKIAFTGMMLALIMLFQYLEKFMPFGGTYLKFNISLVFIMATLYILNFKWSILLIILRFLIGPALSGNYEPWNVWGHFILLLSGVIYMFVFYLSNHFLNNVFKKNWESITIASVITIIFSSFILTLLNGLLFSPVYWWIFKYIPSPSISDAKLAYRDVYPIAFFGISNYWGGIFAVYMTGNIIKFIIVSICFVGLWRVIKHIS